jgi:hypothetical protein
VRIIFLCGHCTLSGGLRAFFLRRFPGPIAALFRTIADHSACFWVRYSATQAETFLRSWAAAARKLPQRVLEKVFKTVKQRCGWADAADSLTPRSLRDVSGAGVLQPEAEIPMRHAAGRVCAAGGSAGGDPEEGSALASGRTVELCPS